MLWLCKQICTASLRPPAQGRLGVGCRICLELVSRCCWRHEIRITWTFTYTQTQHRWVTQVWITEKTDTGEKRHTDPDAVISEVLQCVPLSGSKTCGQLHVFNSFLLSRENTKKVSALWTRTDAAASCLLMLLTRVRGSLIIPLLTFPQHPRNKTQFQIKNCAGDKSKAHCSLPFDYKNCYSLYVRQRVLKTQWSADVRVQKKHVLDYLSEILKYSCWNCCWQWKAPLTNHIFNQAPLEYSTHRKAPNLHQSVGSPLWLSGT